MLDQTISLQKLGPAANTDFFQVEQTRLLYSGLPFGLMVSTVIALLLSAVMWSVTDAGLVVAWVVLFALLLVARLAGAVAFRRVLSSSTVDASLWLRRFRLGAVAAGVVWGVGGALFFPLSDIAYQVFVAFVLAGLCAGAITTLAVDRVSSIGFAVSALLPLIVCFIMQGDRLALSMGLMIALFLFFVAASALRIQRGLYENIKLRIEAVEREQALRDSEIHFRSLAENVPVNIARWDTQGHYLYINPTHERTLGVSLSDIIGTLIPDSRGHVKAGIAQVVATGQAVEIVRQTVPVNGIAELHDISLVPEFDEAGHIVSVLGIGRNMTDNYSMQEAIAAREQEFRNLAESLPESIIRYDLEHRIRYLNGSLVNVLGLGSVDEVIGKHPNEVWPDGRYTEIVEAAAQAIETGSTTTINTCLPDGDGNYIYGQIIVLPERDRDGQITGTIAVGRDFTAIHEAEQRLTNLIENLPGMAYTFRMSADGQGSFPYISTAIEELYGLNPEDVKEDMAPIHDLAHPEDRPKIEAAIAESARTLEPLRFETRVCRPGYPERWLEVRSKPEREADGGTVWHGIMLDITERKLAQQQSELLDFAINLSPDAIFLMDEQLRFNYVNDAACRSLGYSRDELLNMGPPDIDPDVTYETAAKAMASLHESHSVAFEARHRTKDGHVFPVEINDTHFEESGKRFTLSVVRNISERKEMEEALKASQNFLTNVVDAIADPVFVKDREHRWVLLNEAFCNFIGCARDELLGKSDFDFFPEEEAKVFWEKDEEVFTNGEENINEEAFTDGNGAQRTIITKKSRYIDATGQSFIVGIILDITERKQMEETLRENEEKLNNLFKLSPLGIALTDKDGRYIEFNEAFRKICGYPENELRELDYWTLTPKEYEQQEAEQLESLARTGSYGPYEKVYRQKNGNLIPIQINGMKVSGKDGKDYIWSIVEDVTARTAYERSLEENAQHTQSILDNVVDGIITIDMHGRIDSFNRAAESIFGYAADEVVGSNIKLLMPEPHGRHHDAYLSRYMSSRDAHIIGETREVEGLRKDGSTFPMEISVSQIQREGEVMFIGVVSDITERKRVEKLKTEFVSTVSHELRTPLTSISGALGLLASGMEENLSEQFQQMLDIAYRNSQRLSALINDLLDMEKLVAGKMHFDLQMHEFTPLVEQAVESINAYGEQYQVRFTLIEGIDVQVRVDADRLQQVLANYLSNAAKYSPTGGQVEVAMLRTENSVRVEVIDHGEGIPAEFRDRIFQKFSQADSSDTRQKSGTGLGLAISKELIERMQGRVGFETEPGRTCFYFELPIVGLEERVSNAMTTGDNGIPSLLVIEDNHDIAAVLAAMLDRSDCRVDVAHDGSEALACLEKKKYDAITLDLLLPDQNGVALIRRVRSNPQTATLPIIVVSAYTDGGKMALDDDYSDIEWLEKPTNEKILLDAVQRALSRGKEQVPAG